ncbi:Predicted glycosyl transferase [Bosea sp. 62]|uniref:glycosyltransferase family protein n=1 Tax=unclassified Bosea (in: a-proteobacteria) TaxID=2653178 RepID=UPI001256B398|nr:MULTISPECIES: glycosyltransferase [unclassified Bosea (in: a-proteobacteria)]CAD5252399.1 Predicted glycosyl transferase [Bosea sp. 7B]CAD5279073.1 Predicted glycosyl transferase [Bosea sp. 21B]CAD5280195.1 Predicted glycosyl transferase [Bosea sp. 46]VVT59581.1 Predicted glycosyl transferase [Bosea sp. EC-HK365B]VXB34893.1 Predicted glycosyl transferase [Bosea sp. 62]
MNACILIAVTHLLGIGHLVRARQLARALAGAGHEVTLVSGGMPDGKAADYRFVQLPPVRTQGTDFRNLLDEDSKSATPERLAARRDQLVALAHELSPDIVITEHFPFGRRQLADEFLALIAAVKAANPRALVLSSIRDVLVAPQRSDRLAETAGRIAMLFDAVLVHGDSRVLPLEASWPVTPEIAGKLVYTGYLAEPPALPASAIGTSGTILVSGGGSAAALPLFETALAAARLLPQGAFHLLIGRGVSEVDFAALRQSAPDNAVVEWARPDFPALLATCALSISQAGYNTVLDLLQATRPALLVPFDAGNETEQALRAAALERAGRARVLKLAEGPQALAAAIEAALAQGVPPAATVDLDGAMGSVAAIAKLLAGRA